jgi:tetrahydromethanopterin S-methyltransferase subunit B
MGEENEVYDLPDSLDANAKRRDVVKKAIDGGREQIKKLENYHDKLLNDYNTRLVPEDRKKRVLENG